MDTRFTLVGWPRFSLVRRPHESRRLHRTLAGAVLAGTLLLSVTLPVSLVGAQGVDGDLDGLFDEDEIAYYLTDPAKFDTDGDGFGDGEEVYYQTDPLNAASMPAAQIDSDGDGLYDDDETRIYFNDPAKVDTDGDGVGDGEEVYLNTDPTVPNGDNGGNPGEGNPGGNPGGGENPGDNPGGGNPGGQNPGGGAMGANCLDAEEAVVLSMINQARAAQGLTPVQVSGPLNAAAERHSLDMGTRNFYDHINPDGKGIGDRILAAGYTPGNPFRSAENIFADQSLETGAAAFAGWQASPGHLGNITNPEYVAIGIARVFVPGSTLGWYWTTTHANAFDVAPAC